MDSHKDKYEDCAVERRCGRSVASKCQRKIFMPFGVSPQSELKYTHGIGATIFPFPLFVVQLPTNPRVARFPWSKPPDTKGAGYGERAKKVRRGGGAGLAAGGLGYVGDLDTSIHKNRGGGGHNGRKMDACQGGGGIRHPDFGTRAACDPTVCVHDCLNVATHQIIGDKMLFA
jgi:hypothetical protein